MELGPAERRGNRCRRRELPVASRTHRPHAVAGPLRRQPARRRGGSRVCRLHALLGLLLLRRRLVPAHRAPAQCAAVAGAATAPAQLVGQHGRGAAGGRRLEHVAQRGHEPHGGSDGRAGPCCRGPDHRRRRAVAPGLRVLRGGEPVGDAALLLRAHAGVRRLARAAERRLARPRGRAGVPGAVARPGGGDAGEELRGRHAAGQLHPHHSAQERVPRLGEPGAQRAQQAELHRGLERVDRPPQGT